MLNTILYTVFNNVLINVTACLYESFTLAKFVSKTVSDSNTRQSLLYLPWPPWAAQHIHIHVMPPKVVKASKEGDISSRCKHNIIQYKTKLTENTSENVNRSFKKQKCFD